MKKYEGMFKMYFGIKGGMAVAKTTADSLRSSVSTINLSNGINGEPAYIVYCDEMLSELASIRNRNHSIAILERALPSIAKQQFIRQALIEEIHQTNEMENVHSTRQEIKDQMLVVKNGKKGKRFDGMIRKYQLLITNEGISLSSCRDVRDLYDSFILDEVTKEDPKDTPDGIYFRKKTVSVVKGGHTIHDGLYPEEAINSAMENALNFLNDSDYDPLIRISAFHYLFGYIHPFYNGNGRMTRFISSYMLSSHGFHILVALRLSYVIKNNRNQYYTLFKNTNDKRNFGDLTSFVLGFLSFINEACQQVQHFLDEKVKRLNHYNETIARIISDSDVRQLLFILVQVSVCEGDSITVNELSRITKLSPYLVRKHLDSIQEYCVLSKEGKFKCYCADLEKLDNIAAL